MEVTFENQRVHFIGIGGIGMSGLARLLTEKGVRVSGSDLSKNPQVQALSALGITVYNQHDASLVESDMTIVYSSSIKQENPEWAEAKRLGCRVLHRSELLKFLLHEKKGLAVTGTHGKTTVSSLLAYTLMVSGLDPSYSLGGILRDSERNSGFGKGEYFVAEADESDGSFLHYHPFGGIVTNLDEDHMDHYKDRETLIDSFRTFMNQVQSNEHLLICGDDPILTEIAPNAKTYGFSDSCDIRIESFHQKEWSSFFDLNLDGKRFRQIEIALPGHHQVLNASAVFAMAYSLGADEEAIRESFRNFPGVGRRTESKGIVNGVSFYEDYAHHPVEIQATLTSIRDAVEDRRLWLIIQPHRYSRVKECLQQFHRCAREADHVIVTDIYSAGESPIDRIDGKAVARQVGSAQYISRGDLAEDLKKRLRPQDILVVMGAGDTGTIIDEIQSSLREEPVKKWNIALVYGGKSVENHVSLISSVYLHDAFDPEFFSLSHFAIDPKGKWFSGTDAIEILKNQSFPSEQSGQSLSEPILKQLKASDLVIPIFHGPNGEDGTFQGFLQMLDLPFAGSDVATCAVAMNKSHSKSFVQQMGIRTSSWVTVQYPLWLKNKNTVIRQIINELSFPLYVKPCHLGSSIGVERVETIDHLIPMMDQLFELDDTIIVEEEVKGRELEFAVQGSVRYHEVFSPCEIVKGGRPNTFNNKYGTHSLPIQGKAQIPADLCEKGKRLASRIFQEIGADGFCRIDFFLDEEERWIFNEINPIPGLTPSSAYPLILEANELSASDLALKLFQTGLRRRIKKDVFDETRPLFTVK